MKSPQNLTPRLTRRHWLALSASALSGCGGGGSAGFDIGGGTAGLPGTGGTGTYALYAQGSISGFGSVIVNGIKFDDGLASVQIDGVSATSAALRLGMVAGVQGQRDVNTTLGTANQIEVWSVAQGVLTQAGNASFTLAGMTIQTDDGTVLDGVASAAALLAGVRVAVWGLQAGADGRRWQATRVALVSALSVVSSGIVQVSGTQHTLNGLLLSGSSAAGLKSGALVRAQGVLSNDGRTLALSSVKLLDLGVAADSHDQVEVEGFVSAVLSSTRFMLGNTEVDASASIYSPLGASVTQGARVEVYGSWQSGVLKANKVELEDQEALHAVEIEAPIEQFTSLANFVVRGQRCNASGITEIGHGTLADLKVGVKIKVKGAKDGSDVLIVAELELSH